MPDSNDQATPGVASDPYLLLGDGSPTLLETGALALALRRMGLNPVAGAADDVEIRGESWLVRLGPQQADIGLAAPALIDESICHPETLWAGSAGTGPGDGPRATLLCRPKWTVPMDRVTANREFFKLAVLLIDMSGAQQIFWSPARLWSAVSAFRQAVVEMLDSGMPPLLHLLAFQDVPGGGIITRGLAFFSNQELHLVANAGLDREEAVRRLARLALDIMINGSINAPRRFPGLVPGETIRVGPATGADGASLLIVTINRE
jgi:hypothetical protein